MNKLLSGVFLAWIAAGPTWAGLASGNDYTLTKNIFMASGSDATSLGDEDIGFTLGEETAGPVMKHGDWELFPGYYGGGRLGTGNSITVIGTRIAPNQIPLYQDHLQVGVPVTATAVIQFSDLIDPQTVASGIQVYKLQDHLGTLVSQHIPVETSLDPTQLYVTVTPATAWEGNTLYALVASSGIRSMTGYTVDPEARTLYLTVLDPKMENLFLQATAGAGSLSANSVVSSGGLTLHLPSNTLTDYAAVLIGKDPENAPLRVDPKIVAEATRKAQAASPYRIPFLMRELTGYDSQGHALQHLAKPTQMTLGMKDAMSAAPATSWVSPKSLSLWTLDEAHHLWVKMPDSTLLPDGSGVTTNVTSLSVYALMGEAVGDASSVYAFPVPWRPHGPDAGTGPGQTGTESAGITFASLPSECTIKIFTVSGELVRTLTHSNITGPVSYETWDVKTTHGEAVASGVYFWHVESSSDSKNGKLVVIR